MEQDLPGLKNTPEDLYRSVLTHLRYSLGKRRSEATARDIYRAVSYSVRDRLVDRLHATTDRYRKADAKRLYYLSMEFLIGRSLVKNLDNLGLIEACAEVVGRFNVSMEDMLEEESDSALGNGGLGRLAACYLDSLATLSMPGFGYGIHYDYGLFKQEIHNGCQRERPDSWMDGADALHIERADQAVMVPMYGSIEHAADRWGQYNPMWMGWKVVIGVPYDIPVPGWGGETVNYLRLYVARPSTEFDIKIFNQGDYFMAVEQKIATEKISKILYPADTVTAGKELRLTQEYFLVACAIRDIMREYLRDHEGFTAFPHKVAIQLNDTHPSLAIAELMRVLVDEYWLEWDEAWDITSKTVAYTNHTLLPEALETWSVGLLEHVLPRHLQIIYEINRRFLDRVLEIWPGDLDRMNRMSLVAENGDKMVRMANLSIVGSHRVNGVSRLHSDLVKESLVPDFFEMWPEKFTNVTNGITPRRWLGRSNPGLCGLLAENLGDGFLGDLDRLKKLEPMADDPAFCEKYLKVRRANKERLGKIISETAMVTVNPDSMFDMQAKRIHEYKRQLLNVLAVMAEYILLVDDGVEPPAPKTSIFAGKAAPGYQTAKDIIRLIHSVADVINRDKRTKGLLKVAFLPDYRVTLAEKMVCAADLSQQISTAGYEASGTGNMKFALNGALTIGTLDGANIEISEEVGLENVYIFGLTTPEVAKISADRSYRPTALYHADPLLRRTLDAVRDGRFSPSEPGLFSWICPYLLSDRDKYFHLADFASYMAARKKAGTDYKDRLLWGKLGILNTSRMGFFSSDRSIRQYAEDIWNIAPVA